MTLAHTLLLFVLPVLVLLVLRKRYAKAPETICLKPDPADIPLASPTAQARWSMPSLLYHPPTKAPQGRNHTSEIKMEQSLPIPQVEIGVKQPYDAFLVLDVEATCRQGTGFEWANEIIVRPSVPFRYSVSDPIATRSGQCASYAGKTGR